MILLYLRIISSYKDYKNCLVVVKSKKWFKSKFKLDFMLDIAIACWLMVFQVMLGVLYLKQDIIAIRKENQRQAQKML